jgi:hypothetical protein
MHKLMVIDVYGKKVINENISSVEGLNIFEINLEKLSKGIYIMVLLTEGMEPRYQKITLE